jgi:outer membrane protein assembly factor BamB
MPAIIESQRRFRDGPATRGAREADREHRHPSRGPVRNVALRSSAALVSLISLISCAAGQTKPIERPDGDDGPLPEQRVDRGRARALQQRLQQSIIRRGADVAVGATESGLAGVPLGGGSTWRFAHAIDSVPFVAGEVVVAEGEGRLFALAASDGHVMWERPSGGRRVRGAGDDGATTVVSLDPLAELGSALLAVDRSGRVLRQIESEYEVGRPAVVGDIALLPFRGRWISGYDIELGVEIGRLPLPEAATNVVVMYGAPYAGEASLLRLDHALLDPVTAQIRPPTPVFAPAVRWLPSAFERNPVSGLVRDRTLAFARFRPPEEEPGIEAGTAYLTSRRLVYAMNVPADHDAAAAVSWLYTHPTSLLAGAAYRGGLALCDRDGMVTFLDGTTGKKSGHLSLEGRITACAMQSDGLSRVAADGSPASLDQQVGDLFSREDEDLLGGKRDVLRYLASRAIDPETTRILVDLATGDTARGVEAELDTTIAHRRVGVEYLLGGLSRSLERRRGDPSSAHPPPDPHPDRWSPVGALADALGALGEHRSTPLLVRALSDRHASWGELARVTKALSALASETFVDDLLQLLDRPGAAKEREPREDALFHASSILLRVGGKRGHARVERLLEDPTTSAQLRARLADLLASGAR